MNTDSGVFSALINRKNIDNNYFLFTSEWSETIDNLIFTLMVIN